MGIMGRRARRLSGSRLARFGASAALCILLANCAAGHNQFSAKHSKYSKKLVEDGEPVPKGGGNYKLGQPYRLAGRTYVPAEEPHYRAEGVASWYGPDFHGRSTANGEVFDMHGISAAHPTLPMPSYLRVTNLANGRSIIVRLNDRGPYAKDRLIDLSIGAAKALDFYHKGLARVRVEYVGRAPMEGSDDRMLLSTLRTRPSGTAAVECHARIGEILVVPAQLRDPLPPPKCRVGPRCRPIGLVTARRDNSTPGLAAGSMERTMNRRSARRGPSCAVRSTGHPSPRQAR